MVIRRETVAYSISKHKKRLKEGKYLLEQLQASEAKLSQASGCKEDVISEYNIIKKDYEMYQSEITRGQVIRSKAQWAEHGERSSKFCIGLEKYNQELKHIKVLKTDSDTDTTDPKLILNHLYEYYSNMYDIKHVNVDDFTNFEPAIV